MKATNPSGKTCIFDEKYHTFRIEDTNQKLSSVSKVQNHFFPDFDAKKIASRCMKKPEYSGMLADEIVKLWGMEGEKSRDEGNCVHEMIKCYVDEKSMVEPISMKCVRLFKCAIDMLSDYKKNYGVAGTEVLVFSESLGIAGFIDLLLRRANKYLIVDWKTVREIKKDNRWEKGNKPLHKLDSCNLNQYMVQLNLLKKILLHENYYQGQSFRAEIVHLQESGGGVKIPVRIMDKEINKMLEMWKGV